MIGALHGLRLGIPFVLGKSSIEWRLSDVVRVVRKHLVRRAHNYVEDRWFRVASSEQRFDISIVKPTTLLIDLLGEHPECFQLWVIDRSAVTKGSDDIVGYFAGLHDRRMSRHAVRATVKPVVGHCNDLLLGRREIGLVVENVRDRFVSFQQRGRFCHDGMQIRNKAVRFLAAFQLRLAVFGRGFDGVDAKVSHGFLHIVLTSRSKMGDENEELYSSNEF